MSPDARDIPGSEVDVPCAKNNQKPLQTSNGIIPVPGPGGYTLLLGGLDISSVLRSEDNLASSQTSRELEWNACEEYPRSISATGFSTCKFEINTEKVRDEEDEVTFDYGECGDMFGDCNLYSELGVERDLGRHA
jgi:hypothetical protein